MIFFKLTIFLLLVFINQIHSTAYKGQAHENQLNGLDDNQDGLFDQIFLDMYKTYMDRVKEHEPKSSTEEIANGVKKSKEIIKSLSGRIKKPMTTELKEENTRSLGLAKKDAGPRPFNERTIKLRDNIKTKKQETIKKLSFGGKPGFGMNPSVSYFQSPEYVNNPLRVNNALREKRIELLHDPTFLREHGRLGQFLMAKGMQNGLFDSINRKSPSKLKSKQSNKHYRKNKAYSEERKRQRKIKEEEMAEEFEEEDDEEEEQVIEHNRNAAKSNEKSKFVKLNDEKKNEEKKTIEKSQYQDNKITDKSESKEEVRDKSTSSEKAKKLSSAIKTDNMGEQSNANLN